MNYMNELNALFDYCTVNKPKQPMCKSEISVLRALYAINNYCGWKTWFTADNQLISDLVGGISKQGILDARSSLKQRGLIDFKQGARNKSIPEYRIYGFENILVRKKASKLDQPLDQLLDQSLDQQLDQPLDHIPRLDKTKTKKEGIEAGAPPPTVGKSFKPPSVDEVTVYCRERGNTVDPRRFVDYYAASGWRDKDGKPVLNWKQRIISWERRDKAGKPPADAASYDLAELEDMINKG